MYRGPDGSAIPMWSPPPTVASSSGPGPFSTPSRKLGYFERLRIGWQLTKVSLGILRKEKGLIVLPFLSLLLTGAAWLVFLISIFFFTATPTHRRWVRGYRLGDRYLSRRPRPDLREDRTVGGRQAERVPPSEDVGRGRGRIPFTRRDLRLARVAWDPVLHRGRSGRWRRRPRRRGRDCSRLLAHPRAPRGGR